MPDPSKLEALKQAGYKILPICGTCQHMQSKNPKSGWGTCDIIMYSHEKHTGDLREASVHHSGSCPKQDIRPEISDSLDQSGFNIFRNQS